MLPVFLGMNAANLLLLSIVFVLGLVTQGAEPTTAHAKHIPMAVFSGMMAVLVHMVTFTYFMATTSWLAAATDKQDLDRTRFVGDAVKQKRRVFLLCMTAVTATMLAMFSGAAADTSVTAWWPAQVHLAVAAVALVANGCCAVGQYHHVRARGRLMDEALAILNGTSLSNARPDHST